MKQDIGFHISLGGLVLVLLWIGLFKFTAAEAKAIVPLVSTSPLMSWLYDFMSVQAVSNLIGTVEILTGILLLFFYLHPYGSFLGAILASLTFFATLSFIFSSPEGISRIENFILPDAFILKDIMALGISISILTKSYARIQAKNRKVL